MPEQIYIGNFSQGLTTNRKPEIIDNDAFPILFNAYSWRGEAKRKRGTKLLAQLKRQIKSVAVPVNPWEFSPLVLVAGAGNLITGPWTQGPSATPVTLETSGGIAPGSITVVVGANTYTEPAVPDGTLVGAPAGSGTINYATGAITIAAGGVGPLTGTFSYFPGLPVMGLRDFVLDSPNANFASTLYPLLLAFDTVYSYQINQSGSNPMFFSTSFYKGTNNPVTWHGGDFQQFWTTNYQKALWATNNVPGFHFVTATYVSGSGTNTIVFTFNSGSSFTLVVGDKVWFNEFPNTTTINGVVGTISVGGTGNGNYTVIFPGAETVSGAGIAQLLTSSLGSEDGIRWYDGDPTGGTGIPTGTGKGWVNFAPPLTATTVSINDKVAGLYYLVGALAIVAFKDRLLFFSPYIETSGGAGTRIQLQDTVIWSWNGTPYYTSLTPDTETSNVTAYYVDETGKGGYLSAGISQPIATVANNEDVLLVGFGGRGRKTRFVYTGNDINPFLFFNINSELPSDSTFSAVTLDKGAIDIGTFGICMTDQQSAERVDLQIPDSVFDIQAINNGAQRVNAIRDFFREWIYFSYPLNNSKWKFPTRSFLLNYRDNTWAIFYENFTTHGNYRAQTKKTWKTTKYKSWNVWNEPWNTGSNSPLFAAVIAGNPQGYVLTKDQGTGEGVSGTIKAIAASGTDTQITSTDHCVNVGDYLLFSGALGTTAINGQIGRVISTATKDVFVVDIPFPAGTYLGLGKYTRLSQPLIQTKAFAPYWNEGKKVRLSVQKYLMETTTNAQVTINIYLSQDPTDPWNDPTINVPPNSLVYSQVLFTCPESINLGLTAANTNLQMPTAEDQLRIWHRFNTSMIGDSVQIGITLNDVQMRNLTYATSEIALHGIQLTVDRSQQLA
jgi:hypothetical protein